MNRRPPEEINPQTNLVTGKVVDAAVQVHTELGPGLLEKAYRSCLAHELRERGLIVEEEMHVPFAYRGVEVEAGFRLDLLVEKSVIVEVKAVEALHPVHFAQVLTYLKLSGHRVGLLINFNLETAREGIHRLVR